MTAAALLTLQTHLDMDGVARLSKYDRERVCAPQYCDCGRDSCRYRRFPHRCNTERFLFHICNHNLQGISVRYDCWSRASSPRSGNTPIEKDWKSFSKMASFISVVSDRQVHIIPAKPGQTAAYCRVSTDSEEQLTSYVAQKNYYTQKIEGNPDWQMAGVFADRGISGTSLKKRTEFNRMIAACKRGRIDLILTKSLSRFARNTVDCLEIVRMLKSIGIGVIFEKENINTLTTSSEFLITLFSGFAQAESESLSRNVSWGRQKSMEAGYVTLRYS